jgi:hypothetical protein
MRVPVVTGSNGFVHVMSGNVNPERAPMDPRGRRQILSLCGKYLKAAEWEQIEESEVLAEVRCRPCKEILTTGRRVARPTKRQRDAKAAAKLRKAVKLAGH